MNNSEQKSSEQFYSESPAASVWDKILKTNPQNANLFGTKKSITEALSSQYPFLPTCQNPALIPLRPPIFADFFMNEMTFASKRLISLIDKFFASHHADDYLNFAVKSGIEKKALDFFPSDKHTEKATLSMARPDIIVSQGHAKFLELNIDFALGAVVDAACIPASYLSTEAAIQVLKNHSIYAQNPLVHFANLMEKLSAAKNLKFPPNIAFFEYDFEQKFHHFYASLLSQYGLPTTYIMPQQLGFDCQNLLSESRKFDFLLRGFPLEMVTFPEDEIPLKPILEALKAKKLSILPNDCKAILSSKTLLAEIWDNINQFNQSDKEFIVKYVPWSTVILPNSKVIFNAKSIELEELLDAKNKNNFVIKKGTGHGGKQVAIGNSITTAEWEQKVHESLKVGDYILQEFHSPDCIQLPFLNLEDNSIRFDTLELMLGHLIIDDKFAGSVARYKSPHRKGAINHAQGAGVSICLTEATY